MKNKSIFILIIMMICVIVLCLIYLLYDNPLDKNIYNTTWYSYDNKTGTFDMFKMTNNSLSYMTSNKEYDDCNKYTYNSKNKVINLNCGKKIFIKEYNNTFIKIEVDDKVSTMFKSIDETLNYEFNTYFNKSILDYTKEKEQIIEILKIKIDTFYNIMNSKDTSVIVFVGDKCSNIECTLLLNVLEKWYVSSKNVYLIDTSNLSNKDINYLSKLNEYTKDYNSNYPIILTIDSKKQINIKNFKCKGFNCNSWKILPESL